MITHEHYCPNCDRPLNCQAYIEGLGVLLFNGQAYCPACFLEQNGIGYPGINVYCFECIDAATQIIDAATQIRARDAREIYGRWVNYFARTRINASFNQDGGAFNVRMGAEVTHIILPPVWFIEFLGEGAAVELAPGEIPCDCNNCGRLRW